MAKHKLSVSPMIQLDHQGIARLVHETMRTYCVMVYDTPAPTWADAAQAHRQHTCDLVRHLSQHPDESPEQYHEAWRAPLVAAGWQPAEHRDAFRKTHPHLVPWADLSPKYRSKQALMFALIRHLLRPGG